MRQRKLHVLVVLAALAAFAALLTRADTIGVPLLGRAAAAPRGPAAPRRVDVAAAYNALTPADGAKTVRLALWRSRHTMAELTTGIAVSNVADHAASVEIVFVGSDGNPMIACGDACKAVVPAGDTHYWWPPELPGVGEQPTASSFGRALITSDQPVVAAVTDAAMTLDRSRRLDEAAYTGVGDATTGRGDGRTTIPLLLDPWVLAPRGDMLEGISGAGVSGVTAMNLDPINAAEVGLELIPQGGGDPILFTTQAAAGGDATFYLPALANVPDGAYAGIVHSDHPVAAVARTDWPASGGAVLASGTGETKDVAVAIFANGPEMCSLVTIQNASPGVPGTPSTVVVEVRAASGGPPVLVRDYTIAPYASMTLRACDDEDFLMNLPSRFLGWLRVKGKDDATAVSVHALIDYVASQKAVSAYTGVSGQWGGSVRSYVPIVHSAWPMGGDPLATRHDTSLYIVNPAGGDDPTTGAVAVTVTYTGVRGDCAGQMFTQGPLTVPAMGQVTLAPGPEGDAVLPAACLAAARIDATGPVIAVVEDEGQVPPVPTATPTATWTPAPTTPVTPTATATVTPPDVATPTTVPTGTPAAYLPAAYRRYGQGNP
jgi:hypothetical protein